MAIIIDEGWAKEDDPIFSNSWMVFSVRKSKPQAKTSEQAKPENQLPENSGGPGENSH
jgi:hypothetical protein